MRPPFTVLLAAGLGAALGAIGIAHGVGLIADRGDAAVQETTGLSSGELLLYGVVAIAIGAVVVALFVSIARGSSFARWTVGLFTVMHVAQGVFVVLRWYDVSPWEGVSSIVIGVAVLYLLFVNGRSRTFFTRVRAAE